MELISIERTDNIVQIELVGQLDVAGMHDIDESFHESTDSRQCDTIVDLSGVTFIASLAMGMLITCAQTLRQGDKQLVLLCPQPVVEESLRAVGLDHAIPIAESLPQAEQLLAQ